MDRFTWMPLVAALLTSCAGGDFSEPLGDFSKAISSSRDSYTTLQQSELNATTERVVRGIVETLPDLRMSNGCEDLYAIADSINAALEDKIGTGESDESPLNIGLDWRALDKAITEGRPCGLVNTADLGNSPTLASSETAQGTAVSAADLLTDAKPVNWDVCKALAENLALEPGAVEATDPSAAVRRKQVEAQGGLLLTAKRADAEKLLTGDIRLIGAEVTPLYKALADYATSIAQAAKAEDIDKLNASIGKLGTGVGNFIAAAATVPTAGLAKPVFDFVIGAANWVITNYLKHKRFEAIKAAVAKADTCMPSFGDVFGKATVSLRLSLLLANVYNLEGMTIFDYEAIREDPAKDFGRFERQTTLVSSMISRSMQITALQAAETATGIDSLVRTHAKLNEALQKDEPSLEDMLTSLQGFLAQVEAFQALVKALDAAEGGATRSGGGKS